MAKVDFKAKLDELLKPKNLELAYLTQFGSHLYGTSVEGKSDSDYKGLFWQPLNDLILQNKCDHVSYSSGDQHEKNAVDDVDISLWSVHYWLYLLRKGDTNAIDLLFSMFVKDDTIRLTPVEDVKKLLSEFYDRPVDLLDLKNTRGYIQYSWNQARKYGLKGSRMGVLIDLKNYFNSKLTGDNGEEKIGVYFDDILSKFDQEFVQQNEVNNGKEKCLRIIGKGFTASTTLEETCERLNLMYSNYGTRAEEAMRNMNLDLKALSHACRCCFQMLELMETGFLVYPLKRAKEVMDVKYNPNPDWSGKIEPLIVSLLDEIKVKQELIHGNPHIMENHSKIIFNHYL